LGRGVGKTAFAIRQMQAPSRACIGIQLVFYRLSFNGVNNVHINVASQHQCAAY